MATDGSVADRVFPLFDHTHDAVTTLVVVVFAAFLGLVAGWLAADFGVRFVAFVVGAVATGYLLYGQPTRRAVVAAGLYSLAGLLALAPIVYELATVASVSDPLAHVLSLSDLLVFVLFWLIATVPAIVAYRIATGPFLPRFRARIG